MTHNNKKQQEGSLMIMTSFLIALFSTMLAGYLLMATSDLKISAHDAWARQSRYVAEAGIHEALYQLTLNDAWAAGFSNATLVTGQTYTVTITNSSPVVTLNSTGSVNGYTSEVQVNLNIIGLNASGLYELRVNRWEEI